ncbi:profilin-1-like [Oncorhynchus tshawytscha]|uniref:Profilin n=1 Tax=Oncorhynchus tshawytscha TaxID=74940 RepID=A0AAZ3P764_ONCTS|nr:profilin-1-like [Oncorhynchus tshawytscha]
MAWDEYIGILMSGTPPFVQEAAIYGSEPGKESVWAATPGGQLAGVTVAEIKAMISVDRSTLFASGLSLGGNKCTVLRDNLHTEGDNTLDVKMRPTATDPSSYSITIAKTALTLIIVKGMKDIPGGKINMKASNMETYLRNAGY